MESLLSSLLTGEWEDTGQLGEELGIQRREDRQGGELTLQGGEDLPGGELGLQRGELTLQGGELSLQGREDWQGGELTLQGGELGLQGREDLQVGELGLQERQDWQGTAYRREEQVGEEGEKYGKTDIDNEDKDLARTYNLTENIETHIPEKADTIEETNAC